MVIIIELRLDLSIRGLKIALRTNLELGPQFAKVWLQAQTYEIEANLSY